jgi:plastocyanin
MKKTSRSTRYFRWIAIAASLATMALALVGFSNALAMGGGTATASKAKSVSIKGFAFHAGTTHVKAGTKITFSNMDGVAHTATGKGFNTGTISPGHSKSVTFSKKGVFSYHCSIHPFMHGKIIVE